MNLIKTFPTILILSLLSQYGFALNPEEERLRGFAEHYRKNTQFDKERSQGENAFLEDVERWELQRMRDAADYRSERNSSEMKDDGNEARKDAAEKKKEAKQYEESLKDYLREKSIAKKFSAEKNHLASESDELDLQVVRPRYDFSKRNLTGDKLKYGQTSKGSSGSSSILGGGNFPPPPNFDDFNSGGGGYVPAPNFPEDFGDVPPPPPPPPSPINGGYGDDGGFNNDFPPPPPSFNDF